MKATFRTLTVLTAAAGVLFASGCRTKSKPTQLDTLGSASGDHPGWVGSGGSSSLGASTPIDAGDFGPGADELGGFNSPVGEGGLDEGLRGVLPSVYFGFDQSAVVPTERAKVDQAAEYLAANPAARLRIEGHCDWRGTAEYNLALGDRRGNSVRQYLAQLQIDPSRVDVLSKGDLEALADGTEDQMRNDRRADLVVLR